MRKQLFLLGTPVELHPTALMSGTLSALVTAAVARDRRWLLSVSAALLWYVADCTHVVGHIVSSQAVAAPMDGVDFGIYPKSVYRNNEVSPQQHIGRSIGGPIASFAATLLFALLARSVPHGLGKKLFTITAIQHGALVVLALVPVPIVDGGVILANMRKLND